MKDKKRQIKLGATGRFPQGKISETDEGELRIAITADVKDNVVRIEFGKQVSWLGLDKKTAVALAMNILNQAAELKDG